MSDVELKPTFKARRIRIQKLIEFIKEKKKATFPEIYQFLMRKYWLSTITIDRYIKDLASSGVIEVKTSDPYLENPWVADAKDRYVVYKGGEENE